MSKTKELKTRFERIITSVWEAVSRASGSPFSANGNLSELHSAREHPLFHSQRKPEVFLNASPGRLTADSMRTADCRALMSTFHRLPATSPMRPTSTSPHSATYLCSRSTRSHRESHTHAIGCHRPRKGWDQAC